VGADLPVVHLRLEGDAEAAGRGVVLGRGLVHPNIGAGHALQGRGKGSAKEANVSGVGAELLQGGPVPQEDEEGQGVGRIPAGSLHGACVVDAVDAGEGSGLGQEGPGSFFRKAGLQPDQQEMENGRTVDSHSRDRILAPVL